MMGSLTTKTYLFRGANCLRVHQIVREPRHREKHNDGVTHCWDRQIDEVVLEAAGFVMNRLIDKEKWAELLHGTPDGNEREKGLGTVCP